MGMIIGMMFVMFCLFNLLPCFIIFPPEVVAVCHKHEDGACKQHQEIEDRGNGKKRDVPSDRKWRALRKVEKSAKRDGNNEYFSDRCKTV